MRFVLQRVKHASVKVDGELIGSIGRGYMVLMGVSDTDTEEITDKMVDKMCKLRIFEDENGKTNCSLADVDGEILLISQFTLYADCSLSLIHICSALRLTSLCRLLLRTMFVWKRLRRSLLTASSTTSR